MPQRTKARTSADIKEANVIQQSNGRREIECPYCGFRQQTELRYTCLVHCENPSCNRLMRTCK